MNTVHPGDRKMSAAPVALVTGGAGFIGSHVVDALLDRGLRVIVVDNLSTGKRDNLAGQAGSGRLLFLEADICDGLFAVTYNLPSKWRKADIVIHLAAQTSVVRSIASPLSDARTNYFGTLQVLEYARHVAAERVVLISSSAVYGDLNAIPVDESHRTAPLSPYGVHKLMGEMVSGYYHRAYAQSMLALRLFNVYGPRQDPSSPYSGVISVFVKRALTGEPLVIYGDGTQTRDFVYVGDVARAVVHASLAAEVETGIFNIGTGRETSINGLGRMIIDLAGTAAEMRHVDGRGGEVYRSVADISEARARLNFRPQTALRDGLRRTLEWFQRDGAPVKSVLAES